MGIKQEVLRLCSEEKLMSIYRIPKFDGVDEFLQCCVPLMIVRGVTSAVFVGFLYVGGPPNGLSLGPLVIEALLECLGTPRPVVPPIMPSL
ncbi:unnamed protein product [Calypogeia fissa]